MDSPARSPRPAPAAPRATTPSLAAGLRARRRDFVGPEHAHISGSVNGEQMLLALGVVRADRAGTLALAFVDAGGLAEVATDLELARRHGARYLFVTLVDPAFGAAQLGRHDIGVTGPPAAAAAAPDGCGNGSGAALATLLRNLHGWARAHAVGCTVLAARDVGGLACLQSDADVPPSDLVTAWTMRLRAAVELCRRQARPSAALHVHGMVCHSSQCGRGEVPPFIP